MKKKLLIIPTIFFLLILAAFFFLLITDRNPSELPSALLNKNVPKFEGKSLFKDKKIISSQIFVKEIVLVNFFATWCKPCLEEHKYIKRFSEKNGIKIIGINYKDNDKRAIEWLNKLGNPYSDVIVDKKGNVAIDWGVYGIPETFIINSQGIIKHRHAGPLSEKIYKKINLIINNIE